VFSITGVVRLLLSQSVFMYTPTVLLVEDEHSLRGLVRKVLERFGCCVVEASSGKMAVDKWAAKKNQIDLLLTDLMLPDGINGRELADQLLAENPKLKVIFTTGYSYEEAFKGAALPEGFQFLQKPYAPSTLMQSIKTALTFKQPVAA
jgi:CheY-like chemotaxis protein